MDGGSPMERSKRRMARRRHCALFFAIRRRWPVTGLDGHVSAGPDNRCAAAPPGILPDGRTGGAVCAANGFALVLTGDPCDLQRYANDQQEAEANGQPYQNVLA
jgi:hypothetical protein